MEKTLNEYGAKLRYKGLNYSRTKKINKKVFRNICDGCDLGAIPGTCIGALNEAFGSYSEGKRTVCNYSSGYIFEETKQNKKCRNCGAEARETGDLFCHNCGRKFLQNIEEIETKKHSFDETNYEIQRTEGGIWKRTSFSTIETLGAKYYTEENADLICEILNNGGIK